MRNKVCKRNQYNADRNRYLQYVNKPFEVLTSALSKLASCLMIASQITFKLGISSCFGLGYEPNWKLALLLTFFIRSTVK